MAEVISEPIQYYDSAETFKSHVEERFTSDGVLCHRLLTEVDAIDHDAPRPVECAEGKSDMNGGDTCRTTDFDDTNACGPTSGQRTRPYQDHDLGPFPGRCSHVFHKCMTCAYRPSYAGAPHKNNVTTHQNNETVR